MPNKILYGSDPELFLKHIPSGKIVSALPILKRDKNNPIDLKSGISKFYYDNALIEFSFSPSEEKQNYINTLKESFAEIKKQIGIDYMVVPQAAHVFEREEIPEEELWIRGCNPDLDIYKQQVNEITDFEDGMRSGSYHLHFGWDKLADSIELKEAAVKLLDIFVGLSEVIISHDESSKLRRRGYGASGNCRFPSHGLEYRTLAPYCLRSPILVNLVFDLSQAVMSLLEDETAYKAILKKINPIYVQEAINTCNKKLALAILNKSPIPKELLTRVLEQSKIVYAAEDFYSNWQI